MLTKREKILLQILGILLLLGLIMSFLFTPAVTSLVKSKADLAEAEEELIRVREIYEYPGLDERMKQEIDTAEANYEYFYSVLNSYTIDGIVNKLLQKNQLKVMGLGITPYEDASYDFLPAEADMEYGDGSSEQKVEKVLVKSTITVNVEGGYNNILRFIDDLNGTSSCLRVNSMTIGDKVGVLGDTYEKVASLKIYVYGVNIQPIRGAVDTNQEETVQTEG